MDSILNIGGDPPYEDFRLGFYRTVDSISNFRFRIKIWRLSPAATKLGQSGASGSDATNNGSRESVRSSSIASNDLILGSCAEPGANCLDEVTLSWQQKIFNVPELKFYSSKNETDFDDDDLRRKLHHDAKQIVQANPEVLKSAEFKIFTLLDTELKKKSKFMKENKNEQDGNELEDDDYYVPITDDPHEEPNVLAQRMADILTFNGPDLEETPGQMSTTNKTSLPTSNIVVYNPTRKETLCNFAGNMEFMVVKFFTFDEHSNGNKPQILDLCTLKYTKNGILELSPDFNQSKKPYSIENNSGTFEYIIEHVSTPMNFEIQKKESEMMKDVLIKMTQQRGAKVGQDFQMSENRTFKMVLQGEIVSAQDFDYDGLFIHYFVDLPLGWVATADSQMLGMTQRCLTTADESTGKDVAHFSHTFEICLSFDLNRLDIYRDSVPKWPQIYFEVISVDSWTRCRTEGYAYTSIPYNAGCYDLDLESWRPGLPGPKAEMKRYFIGGTPELDDLAYVGTPGDVDGKVLSRFGFRTISSGSIRFRMNVLHQSRAFLMESSRQKLQNSTLMGVLSSATLFSSITNIIEAFEKARQRMSKITGSQSFNEMKSPQKYAIEEEEE